MAIPIDNLSVDTESLQFHHHNLAHFPCSYLDDVLQSNFISSNGSLNRKCTEYIEEKYSIFKSYFTPTCTAALEMSALVLDFGPEDEIIIPAYSFVSPATAFMLRGSKLVFADNCENSPNIDMDRIEPLINAKTKAIMVIHYAGIACDMDKIREIADHYQLLVIEDAAQCFHSYYKSQALGTIGDIGTISFGYTKNISIGAGGALYLNNPDLLNKADDVYSRGTNRQSFLRKEVEYYEWVGLGSNYSLSEIQYALLMTQFEKVEEIQAKRMKVWNTYFQQLSWIQEHGYLLPFVPDYASNHNGHIFYVLAPDEDRKNKMVSYLKERGIPALPHFRALHESQFAKKIGCMDTLPQAEKFTKCLIRLPLHPYLTEVHQDFIMDSIESFVKLNG